MMKKVVKLHLESLNFWQWTDLSSHFSSSRKSPSTHSTGGSVDHKTTLNTAAKKIASSPVIKPHSSNHPAPSLVIEPNELREFLDISINFKTKRNFNKFWIACDFKRFVDWVSLWLFCILLMVYYSSPTPHLLSL
jgi:hypothetical protein